MAQKKAPVPESSEKAVISVRIPAELRRRLDRAAEESGKSLTDEISGRLATSLAAPEAGPNQELFKDIAKAVKKLEAEKGKAWPKDAWVTQHLAQAVTAIVRELGAKGEAVEPEGLKLPKGVKPSAYGEWVGETIVVFGDPL